MFLSFVANLFHEFVGDLGSFVRPGGMRGAITIKFHFLREFALHYERHLEGMRTVPWLRPAGRDSALRHPRHPG